MGDNGTPQWETTTGDHNGRPHPHWKTTMGDHNGRPHWETTMGGRTGRPHWEAASDVNNARNYVSMPQVMQIAHGFGWTGRKCSK
eukprot:2394293-Heterocapsa_arctica.AAC.1